LAVGAVPAPDASSVSPVDAVAKQLDAVLTIEMVKLLLWDKMQETKRGLPRARRKMRHEQKAMWVW
jgi:hypothetical protein